MAKARAIVRRLKAVQNIRKITRTMQLIATARYQAALDQTNKARPYAEGIDQMTRHLCRGLEDLEHPLLKQNTQAERSVLFVLTSNRGLCGGYNGAVLRKATDYLNKNREQGKTVDLHMIGKKGIAYSRFAGWPMTRQDTRFEDRPAYAEVEAMASEIIEAYTRQEINAVYVSYTRYVSTAVQRAELVSLLPIDRPAEIRSRQATETPVQFDFNPEPDVLLAELLPEMVKIRLFQCFMDAAVSEQVARMVAMKGATDAANDMIRTLTQQYNRARQTQITLELLDIVGGANALS
ncbi:MAG: ATP synthase F1 subunit gamma [Phycisphaerales bacterium]|nr:ATP synthase F1 subunit gamma [Phycisphaerales bacterium]